MRTTPPFSLSYRLHLVSVLSLACVVALAQTALTQTPAKSSLVQASDAVPLETDNQVSSSISVDSVLLPYKIASRTFGGEIADNYAVVQITISNHNPSSELIVHSVLLDYSEWLFNGRFSSITGDGIANSTMYQQQNKASQVSSAEARIVRGEALDKQPWTARNVVLRAATTIGTLATGFQFLTTNVNYLSGIASYGNSFVPALGLFWPDATVTRLNRISDFGFSTNHVVPKGASDIIVAFFPIDRFLTSDLKKLYKKDPAAFFNPTELVFSSDKKRKLLLDALDRSGAITQPPCTPSAGITCPTVLHDAHGKLDYNAASAVISRALMHYEATDIGGTPPTPEEQLLVKVLSRVSLNNIRVLIGGIMTVDTATVPAVLASITFADAASTRVIAGTYKGTIRGTFLGGGVVNFIDAATGKSSTLLTAGITDKTSSDTQLTFTYTVAPGGFTGDPLQAATVAKTSADKAVTTSAPLAFDFNPPKPALSGSPTVKLPTGTLTTASWAEGKTVTLTLTGTALKDGSVALTSTAPDGSPGILPTVTSGPSQSDTSFDVTLLLPNLIPTGTKLTFTVKTVSQDGTTQLSNSEAFTVSY